MSSFPFPHRNKRQPLVLRVKNNLFLFFVVCGTTHKGIALSPTEYSWVRAVLDEQGINQFYFSVFQWVIIW
jgi:hypothetical protein